jgi:hypothetical protein
MSTRISSFILAIMIATGSGRVATAQSKNDIEIGQAVASNSKLTEVERKVQEIVQRHGHQTEAAIWLSGATGSAWIEHQATARMPSASAIKTFFLVEFFADRKDALDAPVPGADAILDDDSHPAIAHFTADQREDIRKTLKGKSAREIGKIMMGSAPASNVAYNAAASLITAVLGGPEGLTRRIHDRDPAFATVYVRRYMLRDRKENGDNEMTARAIAELYRKLATQSLKGMSDDTTAAVRNAIIREGTAKSGFEFVKSGALDTDPLTRVEAGWKESHDGAGPVVFVVMLWQPKPGEGQARKEAGTALGATCVEIRRILTQPISE